MSVVMGIERVVKGSYRYGCIGRAYRWTAKVDIHSTSEMTPVEAVTCAQHTVFKCRFDRNSSLELVNLALTREVKDALF